MKKIKAISGLVFSGVIIMILLSSYMSTENTPAGYTGSPADDKDCSSCHKAKAKATDNIFSINAENNTYTPGKRYSVTMKLSGNEKSRKFGFQVSPQTESGKLLGKMILTDSVQTKLANAKYLNQTAKGVDGNGDKKWSFDWVAPAKGSGPVVFYGSFLIGGKSETVLNSTLSLKEKK